MLTAKQVQNAKPGRHLDGSGLYLNVSPSGKKTWILRYSRDKRVTESSLGSAEFISLADARAKAFEFRKSLATGVATPKQVTFEALARENLHNRLASYKHPHVMGAAYERHLRHASPLLPLSVASISIDQVVGVLRPLWQSKPQTADRIRGLIEQVLDVAIIKGLRVMPNPARYRGTLSHILGRKATLTRGHQRALPYAEIPQFYRRLEESGGVVNRSLQFLILTGLRKDEVQSLQWSDLSENGSGPILTIPPERMKLKKAHRVPLTPAMIAILDAQRALGTTSDLVFVSPQTSKKLSPTTLNEVLRRWGINATPHGMRSCLRDWIANETDFPRDLAEACLAHAVQGVESAYRRSDMIDRRRAIMMAWNKFVSPSR